MTEKQKAIAKICTSITGIPCTHYGQKPNEGAFADIFANVLKDLGVKK